MIKKLFALPALLALILTGSLAMAQAQETAEPQGATGAQEATEPMELDQATKDKFVSAYGAIMAIQMRYSEELQNATDEETAAELQQAAQTEMQEAVASNDLTIEEYNQIIQLASADPELMTELESAIEESMTE